MCVCLCVPMRPRDLVCFGALSNMLHVVANVLCSYVNTNPAHAQYPCSDVYLCSRLAWEVNFCARALGWWRSTVIVGPALLLWPVGPTESRGT